MVECPTCEKSVDTERGLKSHRVQVHDEDVGEGRATVTLTCDGCGDKYEKRKDRADQSRFCSGECQRKGRSTRGRERESRGCEVCDQQFTTHPNDDQRFCSPECFHEWRTEYMSGSNSPIANKVKCTCEECGEEFKRAKSRAELNDSDYCSRECYHENHTGENAPRWRGGSISYYGPTWLSQRQQALERDSYQCQDCGETREEHYEKYGHDLEVHHKTPFRTFDDSTKANRLPNLITVCNTCHMERESG